MSVLIVGGDHLGSIPKELDKLGVNEVRHLTGRSSQRSVTAFRKRWIL